MTNANVIPLDPDRITGALVDLIAQQLAEVRVLGRRLTGLAAELEPVRRDARAAVDEVDRLGHIIEDLAGNIWLALFGEPIAELEAPR